MFDSKNFFIRKSLILLFLLVFTLFSSFVVYAAPTVLQPLPDLTIQKNSYVQFNVDTFYSNYDEVKVYHYNFDGGPTIWLSRPVSGSVSSEDSIHRVEYFANGDVRIHAKGALINTWDYALVAFKDGVAAPLFAEFEIIDSSAPYIKKPFPTEFLLVYNEVKQIDLNEYFGNFDYVVIATHDGLLSHSSYPFGGASTVRETSTYKMQYGNDHVITVTAKTTTTPRYLFDSTARNNFGEVTMELPIRIIATMNINVSTKDNFLYMSCGGYVASCTVDLGGTVNNPAGITYEYGFEYRELGSPSFEEFFYTTQNYVVGGGTYVSNHWGFLPNRTYEYRAVARVGDVYFRGNLVNVSTPSVPIEVIVSTDDFISRTHESITIGGRLTKNNVGRTLDLMIFYRKQGDTNFEIIDAGITSYTPTSPSDPHIFSRTVTDLDVFTTYEFKVVAADMGDNEVYEGSLKTVTTTQFIPIMIKPLDDVEMDFFDSKTIFFNDYFDHYETINLLFTDPVTNTSKALNHPGVKDVWFYEENSLFKLSYQDSTGDGLKLLIESKGVVHSNAFSATITNPQGSIFDSFNLQIGTCYVSKSEEIPNFVIPLQQEETYLNLGNYFSGFNRFVINAAGSDFDFNASSNYVTGAGAGLAIGFYEAGFPPPLTYPWLEFQTLLGLSFSRVITVRAYDVNNCMEQSSFMFSAENITDSLMQLKPFPNQDELVFLVGGNSATYNLSEYFVNYYDARLQFNDPICGDALVNIYSSKPSSYDVYDCGVKVEVYGQGNDVFLRITGKNNHITNLNMYLTVSNGDVMNLQEISVSFKLETRVGAPILPVELTTHDAAEITNTSAVFNGSITKIDPGYVVSLYFDYRKSTDLDWIEKFVMSGVFSTGYVESPINNLSPATTYVYRIRAVDQFSVEYFGNQKVFNTIGDIIDCMDPAAINYNPYATIHDGDMCIYELGGCMDPEAFNYNPSATFDDDSCVYEEDFIYGCTDKNAKNYNPRANIDDDSCVPKILGCTDSRANNYNPGADVNDGSCQYDDVIPPVVTNVEVVPGEGFTNTSFTCSWDFSDPQFYVQNGTVVKWYLDSDVVKEQVFNQGDSWPVLSSSYTSKNKLLVCGVQGSNGLSLGNLAYSNSVFINNSAPNIISAFIDHEAPTKKSIFLCNTEYFDADNDAVTVYARYFNSTGHVIRDWSAEPQLLCEFNANCKKGETIWCEARVFDGEVNSTSTAISNNITIGNTPPSVSLVAIYPLTSPLLSSEDLFCHYVYADIDGDAEVNASFKWYKGGVLQPLITQTVDSSYTSPNDLWRCGVSVFDGSAWSTQRNSTLVMIDKDAPIINSITVPESIVRNTVRSVSWEWIHSNMSGSFNHYICSSNVINSSGCEENKTVCSISSNNQVISCNIPFNDVLSKTLYLQIYDSSNEGSLIEPIEWDFVFEVPTATAFMYVESVSNGNKFTCEATNLPSGFAGSAYYSFYQGNTLIRGESTNNVFTSSLIHNNGAGTTNQPITCRVRLREGNAYSVPFSTSTHLLVDKVYAQSNARVNQNMKVYAEIVNNQSSVSNVVLSLRSPLNTVYSDLEMTFVNGRWEHTFAPFVLGYWRIMSVRVEESSFSYLLLGDSDQDFFMVLAPLPPEGGGGGGEIIEIITLPVSGNVTGFCGDGVCQEWEDPFNCWQDCKVNLDTLFTCIWDKDIECNWQQSWFAAGLLIFLVGIIGVSIVYYELRRTRKKR